MVMKPESQSTLEFRIVPAGKFKATCLQLMEEVAENPGLHLIITKRSKPVAQLTAPPIGLKLTGPTANLVTPEEPTPVPQQSPAKEPHGKKRKGKKKKK
jgi:antitoxin (DNA-binding transcriptional repressor) of toxin-antitoxin stability system